MSVMCTTHGQVFFATSVTMSCGRAANITPTGFKLAPKGKVLTKPADIRAGVMALPHSDRRQIRRMLHANGRTAALHATLHPRRAG